jgi:hypothetical protein
VHDTRLRELPLDEVRRPVGRGVVGDHDVQRAVAGVREDAAEAAAKPVRLVRRDDDDRKVVHGVCLGV